MGGQVANVKTCVADASVLENHGSGVSRFAPNFALERVRVVTSSSKLKVTAGEGRQEHLDGMEKQFRHVNTRKSMENPATATAQPGVSSVRTIALSRRPKEKLSAMPARSPDEQARKAQP